MQGWLELAPGHGQDGRVDAAPRSSDPGKTQPDADASTQAVTGYLGSEADVTCCFCGYEPMEPDAIYSEVFDGYVCPDCEQIALRVLTSISEAGKFHIGRMMFEVRRLPGRHPTSLGPA